MIKKLALAVLAFAALSCAREEMTDPSVQGGKLVFTAGFEQPKTQVEDQLNIYWGAGDSIHVFNGKTSLGRFVSTNTKPQASAEFVSDKSVVAQGSEFLAVSPYNAIFNSDGSNLYVEIPDEQYPAKGTFDPRAFVSVARTDTNNFDFYNVCGGMLLTVSTSGISYITIAGNGSETLAGQARIKFDATGRPAADYIIDPKKAVNVYGPDGGDFVVGNKYLVPLLPATLSSGFTVTYHKNNGTKASYVCSQPVQIKRATFGKVLLKDQGLNWVPDYRDLSEGGTANCYVVNRKGNYRFKASFKGSSAEVVDGTPASAAVVWESVGTSTAPASGSVITGVSYSDGYVSFSTPASGIRNGNALIAVKDANNTILWSWHIWVCNGFDAQTSEQVYNRNAAVMMDRNLGALSADKGNPLALGLLYQWGRKDPFMGGYQLSYGSDVFQTKAASTGNWFSVQSDANYGTLKFATQNPMHFILKNEGNGDWLYTAGAFTDDTRWQTSDKEKGMYDPCPPGWRVPDGGWAGMWTVAFDYGNAWQTASNWDNTNKGMDFAKTDRKLGTSSRIWYPSSGYIFPTNFALYVVGKWGLYWSASVYSTYAYAFNFDYTGVIAPSYADTERSRGFAVRCCKDNASSPTPIPAGRTSLDPVKADPMSWVAVAPDGSWMENYSKLDSEKQVGIYYFLWLGCHGYDNFEMHNEVHYPTSSDTNSPYNNEEIYKLDPDHPKTLPFGPFDAFHHWGEPYLGYYLSDDRWVYRKHAQMLSDAGVDAVFCDVTNGFVYTENLKIMCDEWTALRKLGDNTPQFGLLLNDQMETVYTSYYNSIYGPKLYQDLWYKWLGKPLILADADHVGGKHVDEFTFRYAWFTYNIPEMDKWWHVVNGVNRMPWGGWYKQKPGYHDGVVENMSVMAATHPLDNMGRSFDVYSWTEPEVAQSDKGIHFWSQFDYAVSQKPKFLFFTGWNEWVAMRQRPSDDFQMLGMSSWDFGCAFVDHFNHEFSRDLEPVRGGFGDTYYYYLADAVRKFKGAKPATKYNEKHSITLDGFADDWYNVKASYGDDKGDATEHNHIGWGRIGILHNHASNDIELCKVTVDDNNIYFYVQTSKAFVNSGSADWMKLFIGVNPKNNPNWEGFNFAVRKNNVAGNTVTLEKSTGGYNWETVCSVARAVGDRIMEISIPLDKLGITDKEYFTVDFKWIDDTASTGDIQTCLSDGDSAPNGRFRYRYIYSKLIF